MNLANGSRNQYGGREHLEAVDFLRQLNEAVYAQMPGTITLAEESSSWPLVSRPTYVGGLGFSLNGIWGGCMICLSICTLILFSVATITTILRSHLMYAFSENFVLPLSHDEVVHIKGSLINKMPGDLWQRFANCARSTAICGVILARNCSLWEVNLGNGVNGIIRRVWTGTS